MFSKPMRVILTAIIAISLVVVLTAEDNGRGTAITAQASEKKPDCVRLPEYKYILKHKVIRFSHAGGNYIHYKIKNRGERRLLRMKACARKAGLDRRLKDMRQVTQHRRARWRFHRKINIITPWGEWAIPTYIVSCESGGDYTKWNYSSSSPERASGAYQIIGSTWRNYGGTQFAVYAAYAKPWQQHIIASRIRNTTGTSEWSCS